MSAVDDALAKFANGTATALDVVTLVPTTDILWVHVHVRRTNPPRPRAQIYLFTARGGPLSSAERDVSHVSGPRHWRKGLDDSVWAAWWCVDALQLWCEAWERKPGNRGVVLPWVRKRKAARGTMLVPGACMPV